ncbi:GTPase IMAP family member 7 isoform X2 [Patella vulgata]|uniref:GTPase IMAP family member 7 isoform X2 n=1 Tax=Patella vulgata TaxID=6465 RepID=UPI00217F2744|nr:GTPase IMAP family member 7 isoform X2 [Patella vulgata]
MVKYTQKGKMAPKGYSKIQSNYTFLLGDLEPTSICFALFQEHLFDQNDIEKVTSKAGTKEQNNQILTILLERSGHNSYEKFIDVLKNLNYDHAVEILESDEFEEIRLVIVGKTGSGKSSLGNSLLNKNEFACKRSSLSVTKECSDVSERKLYKLKKSLKVLDTPGFFDTRSDVNVATEIARCILKTAPGPHIFIYVMSINSRFSKEEEDSIDLFKNTFGKHALDHLVVVFTGADQLEDQTLDQWLKEAPVKLHAFLDECKHRYAAINNKAGEEELKHQVMKIAELLAKTHKNNEDKHYTNRMYKEAEAIFREKKEEAKREGEKKERKLKEQCNKLFDKLNVQTDELTKKEKSLVELQVAFKAKDADITRLKQEREAKIRESKRLESKARDEEIARLKQEQESKRLSKVIDELQETQKKQWKQIIDYEAMLNSTPSMERNTESIKCNQCLHTVAHGSDLLNIPGVGALEKSTVTVFGAEGVLKQKFINETDDIFDVYTTSKADIKVTSNRIGHPKYVWYDIGYDWSYMHCKGKECKNQIGWKYQKNGDTPFYGLIDANVTD